MKNIKLFLLKLCVVLVLFSCNTESKTASISETSEKNVVLFFVNDQHARLNNFSKIKHIIDKEKQTNTVFVACSGDMFSGSPIVDNYKDAQGYPMIDVMNKTGFDVSVLGNHEFDYGPETLKDRVEQANFSWVCANVNMLNSGVPQTDAYKTIEKDGVKITFLGLVETNGKPGAVIPSTHPWKVKAFKFKKPQEVVTNYKNIKEKEKSDVVVALTHLGFSNNSAFDDVNLANQFSFIDMVIGGHSHQKIDTIVNNTPIYQSGSYLKHLGKVELTIKNKTLVNTNYTLINLDTVTEKDKTLEKDIASYNNLPFLDEVVGNSVRYHPKNLVGCFYADALQSAMKVDLSFQNSGGVRSYLDKGAITKKEIFTIEPFNNGTVVYNMTVKQIKNFLKGSKSGFYYAGLLITQTNNTIVFTDKNGHILKDDVLLRVGLNDYIPAVHDVYFPKHNEVKDQSAAESLIYYLQHINQQVDYKNCTNFFRYST